MNSFRLSTSTFKNLCIVKTDRSNRDHHGLHTNTAPHVLARSIRPGDVVLAVLECHVTTEWSTREGDVTLRTQTATLDTCSSWREPGQPALEDGDDVFIAIESHLGRDVALGEDGAEEAFGQDVLADLLLEALSGECGWNYAPITARPDPNYHSGEIIAKRTTGEPWVIDRINPPKKYDVPPGPTVPYDRAVGRIDRITKGVDSRPATQIAVDDDGKLRCSCGSNDLVPETLGGMPVYREREGDKGTRLYRTKCNECGMTDEVALAYFPDVPRRR